MFDFVQEDEEINILLNGETVGCFYYHRKLKTDIPKLTLRLKFAVSFERLQEIYEKMKSIQESAKGGA